MKKLIAVLLVLICTPIVFAVPIDFDNLHVASTTYGTIGGDGHPRLLAAYKNNIYFIVMDDGTATPSKVYCYDPSDGLSNAVNHTILVETTGKFVTLREIDGLLYFSDNLGNVYSYDGTTLTEMSGTPFTDSDYVSSIENFSGNMYFGTSTSNIFRYNGTAFEQVYGVSENRVQISDMVAWQKDGYIYASVGHINTCCPPTGYVIRSNSGNLDSWETVFQGFWAVNLFLATEDYLYSAVTDTAYSHSSTIRKSTEGTTFPAVFTPSNGIYKRAWGSFYNNGLAYFFADGDASEYGYGTTIVDDNGSVSITPNQSWALTQAVELNGEVYALAGSYTGYLPGEVYLITTNTLTVASPDGGEELVAGQTDTITWQALESIENISIEFSSDNGNTWTVINADTPNDGEYGWTLPEVTSNQCLVRISDVSNPSISDTSDEVFTIYVCQGPVLGDVNNDCYFDLLDFALMSQNWLGCGNPFDPVCTIDNDLVAYWSFDEGSGTISHDAAGNNDGSLIGDPIWVNGISGMALEFDGNGDYVDVADAPSLNPTEAITITAWFKADPFAPQGTYGWPSLVAKYITGVGGYDLSVQKIYEGTPQITTSIFLEDIEGGHITLQESLPTEVVLADTWYFTAMTYDSSELRLYRAKDGETTLSVISMSGGGSLSTSDSHLNIGECPYNPGRYWDGAIDEVRIYNRALTPTEVEYLYQIP